MRISRPAVDTVPVEVTRRARREGTYIFAPPVHLDEARTIEVPGRGEPITVRIIPPDQAPTGIYLHIHGGGWTLGSSDEQDVPLKQLANATGLVPDVPGMHGPSATVEQLHAVFCPRDEGGLLSRKGVVDFTVARGVAPGVFAVAEMRHPRLRERMGDLQLGAGPYYTFFRPYHLTSLEVPLSAAAAVLHGASHMRPLATPVAEVGARAKRDLAPGQKLDAIGEYCYRGFALTRTDAIAQNALPLGLAQGATVTNRIAAGDYLTYANCAPDEKLEIVKIRHAQDAYVRMAAAA